jgi:NADP-dependent 3-hydroxy acid dehydrogenase YdfG
MELRGAVVVVTGASSGIGEAAAVAFARRGARLVLAARRVDRLEELATRIQEAGGRAVALRCDVTDTDELTKLPGVVEATVGPTDVLVNNAGIPGGGSFDRLTHEQIDRVVRVNLLGVLHATRAFLPGMLARGYGHVVNVASLSGRFAVPGAAVYTATKHAVVAFSESLDYDTSQRGVRVTSVNPGFVRTEGFPQDRLPPQVVMTVDPVSDAIVKVVRDGIAPEYSVPRWIAPLQAFRVLTPPLYRWGVRAVRGIARPTETPT